MIIPSQEKLFMDIWLYYNKTKHVSDKLNVRITNFRIFPYPTRIS